MTLQRTGRLVVLIVLTMSAAGCALYNDVTISQLTLSPGDIDRGSDVPQMIRKNDYLRAIELASAIDARSRKSAVELAALGDVFLASGRYDLARRYLRAALDLQPRRDAYADIAWSLSQVEYMQNNYGPSLEWANVAREYGMQIRRWHIDYIEALADTNVYHFPGTHSDSMPMRIGRPDVPRVEAKLNGRHTTGIIDSGAVLSIVSRELADAIPIRRLGTFRGEFFGLLGEPISVEFGIVDRLELGDIVIENVPVAIMPDDKMRFVVAGRKPFHMQFLLGANLLKEFRLELDFGRERATFTKLTARDRVPDPQQNLFIRGFRPHVRGTINRRGWYLFILDTGSEVTFLNDSHMRVVPLPVFGPKFHGATMQGLGGSTKTGAKVEDVQIGVDRWGGTFRTLPMYTSEDDLRVAGIVGENYLKNFRVVLDFGRMRLDLQRN